MNKELKPCPFCGGEAKLISDLIEMHNYVSCMDCYCRTQVFTTKARAIDKWNTRKPIDKVVEQLEEELKSYVDASNIFIKEIYDVMVFGMEKAIEIVKKGGSDE